MSARSRFEENLRELNRAPSRTLLAIEDLPATPAIAEALSLPPQAPLTLVMQLATADGAPVSLNRNYFPRDLLPGIAEAYRAAEQADAPDLATTKILASLGVADFRRRTIRIRGRAATDLETRHLRMVPNEPVFEVEVLNVDAEARPVTLGLTSFCQSRVEFFWDYPDTEDRT
jgi:GntR family phosphonate transport system transcriptional regulator